MTIPIRLAAASLLLTSLFGSAALRAQPFAVGSASAARGQKATGVLAVPAGSDAALDIPVAVVHGAKPGPVLALVAGAHGTEYASIIAIEKLIERLDPAEVSGTVILVPLINLASFEQKVPHVNPVDGKSMNRFYPGKTDGTQTERALYAMTKQVVERCDYLIDFHGGDLDEDLRPYSYWVKTGNAKQDATSRQMVLAFGLGTIIISADRPADPTASKYLDATASSRGKPAITVEAGHAGTVEPLDVAALVDGSLSVMRLLRMLAGEPSKVENPVWIESIKTVASERGGIFYPLVDGGAYVAKDMKIGYVTDYVGQRIFEARAPVAGIVLYVCAVPSMKKGDTIANIGVVAAAPPP
jgi:predicted deacylase